MDTLEVLMKARAEIEKGWCQGVIARGGNVCAVGGLKRVLGIPLMERFPGHEFPAFMALARALDPADENVSISMWNDDDSTTKADVLALYDKAIAAEAVKASPDPAHVHAVA